MEGAKNHSQNEGKDDPAVVTSSDGKEVDAPAYKSSTGWNLEDQTTTTTNHRKLRFTCIPTTWTWTISDRFDRVLPPHKRIMGLKRKTFCLTLLAIFFCLLGLAIGIPVGLSANHKERAPNFSGNGDYHGDLTYYGTGMGACGQDSKDSDAIVAVSQIRFDAASVSGNPNENPLCGRKIRIIRNGKSADVTVVDRCTGCKADDLDVSMSIFDRLAIRDEGRVPMTWSWI